ncbi:thiosulfate sulfurtransferase GlpE [Alloalcanivorax gelatiniphagus]|uniref:Thiosulfate sulfurtransferase GlpE n=1 Tax=Alloalcanivorax gelatiniphagus TaxID=1194167 RepID=A0ABY2XLM8_9GAMM|nr:thiosulfate sulfurtransferase GlpE [Alloalcanivorax gelatiniphagus]TMW12163.1 thiosulfate sulfurtransferase GlpE [Alloalcanivorax gelatiniphagus]|tara:strand:+ start:18861 stop:19187 length:327 start_codon:yes stop_codon:yes gene_type:complete
MAERIGPEQGLELLQAGGTLFIDVRDPESHQQARIPGALPLNQAGLEAFLATTDRAHPLVVYCYHGHSSQAASDYLNEQGFQSVVSLDGGFEYWRQAYPDQVEPGPAG